MEERIGLLSGELQAGKYPDLDDKKYTRSEEKIFNQTMAELDIDTKKNLRFFEAEGVRQRSPEEIRKSKENLAEKNSL